MCRYVASSTHAITIMMQPAYIVPTDLVALFIDCHHFFFRRLWWWSNGSNRPIVHDASLPLKHLACQPTIITTHTTMLRQRIPYRDMYHMYMYTSVPQAGSTIIEMQRSNEGKTNDVLRACKRS